MTKAHPGLIRGLARSLPIVVGIVLIWRGVWYAADYIDTFFFDGVKLYTVIGGILVGLALLYVPDKDFKELEKL